MIEATTESGRGRQVRVNHWRAAVRLMAGAVVTLAVLAGCADGDAGDRVDFVASINGFDVGESRPNDPVGLRHERQATVEVTATNVSNDPVVVRHLRLEGTVVDMVFLNYDTGVRVPIGPGETVSLPPVSLDFFDLGGQATGYLRGHLQLFDEDREPLGSEQVFLDSRGGGLSTLGWFNLFLLGATLLGVAWTLIRLAQRRLPANRFVRGLRLLAIGFGAGLTLSVAFSTLRIWPLPTLTWVLITVIAGLIGYVIGMILPGADDQVIDVLDEQDVLDAVLDERVTSRADAAAPEKEFAARATKLAGDARATRGERAN